MYLKIKDNNTNNVIHITPINSPFRYAFLKLFIPVINPIININIAEIIIIKVLLFSNFSRLNNVIIKGSIVIVQINIINGLSNL